jgi:3-hydroxyacyl-CoA dehydrogenase
MNSATIVGVIGAGSMGSGIAQVVGLPKVPREQGSNQHRASEITERQHDHGAAT